MSKRLLALGLSLALMLPLALFGLLSSASGSHWLLMHLLPLVPGKLSINQSQGRFIDHIELSDVNYQSDSVDMVLQKLILDWQAKQLFSAKLHIIRLSLDGLYMQTKPKPKATAEAPFDAYAKLFLPVQIQIDQLLLTNAEIKSGATSQNIQKLQLSLATEGNELKLNSLVLEAAPLSANIKGQAKLGEGFPLTISADWQVDTKTNGLWQSTSTVSGDLKQLVFANQSSAPFKLNLKGQLNNVLTTPGFNLNADWQALQWPISANTPQIKTTPGNISVKGLINAYQLSLQTQLVRAGLPNTGLSFNAHGNQNSLIIDQLELASNAGVLQINGSTAWQNAPEFDLNATGKQFNPAILMPELTGNLNFATQVKAKLGKSLSLTADINQFSGQLRGYPIKANGRLSVAGQQLQVNTLKINVGANAVAVNGQLDQNQAGLDFTVNAPRMAELWPGLAGNLQGSGHLQGAWVNPNIHLQVKGKALSYAQHRLAQLAVNVAYQAEANKPSTATIIAENISSSGLGISKLQLAGLGSLAQHSLTIDINSNAANLVGRIAGQYHAQRWSADINRFDISRNDTGLWQLKHPAKLTAQLTPTGLLLSINETCLSQANAFLCADGRYAPNKDFQAHAKASSLPASLLQPFLPSSLKLNTQVNAQAEFQQSQGLLTGTYELHTTPAQLSLRKGERVLDMALGSSKLSGRIKAGKVLADADLNLVGQDYVRAQLALDTGKSQALSGQVSAELKEFALLETFLPQVSALKGHLHANLGVKGKLSQPVINGQIDLTEGNVDLADAGLGLRNINLHANTIGNQGNSLQLQLSAAPVTLKDSQLSGQVKLKGLLSVNADLQHTSKGLSGTYQLNLPAQSITLMKPSQLPLGMIALTGRLDEHQQTAELSASIIDKDFIKGQLRLDKDTAKTLSGKLTASINELGFLNPFVPELANIKGNLGADLNLAGTLEQPSASGSINLNNAALDINRLGLTISNIKLQAIATHGLSQQIQITGYAKSGAGMVNINGLIGLAKAQRSMDIHLTGSDFEVAKLPEAQITISPDLKLALTDGKAKVTGIIKIPKALLQMEQIPENAVAVSKDEVIIGEGQIPQAQIPAPGIDANVEIALGKQVSFSGQGLKTDLSGKLNIVKTDTKTALYGTVDMGKARYKSYGQDLTVRKGRFVFNGPLENPWLEVEAIRVSSDKKVTAILLVSGPLNSPKTTVSTDPALPETEALAYLVTGRPLNQVSKSEGNLLASAALSYGAGKAAWLTDKLGIDEFEVQEGATLQDTLVSVGQYLTPKFYLGTKVGLFNKQASLILKYLLTEHINVETQTGSSKRVKLNYEYDRD